MTIADLIKEWLETAKDRLKTPISGAFLWSFIIWNWRAIAVLLFSEASIEDRIVVINHEYCNFWAILFPAFLAIIYIVFIPKLMLEIDKTLIGTKKKRVDNIYESKEHTVDKKIILAGKESILKNVESGNKKIDELQGQIKSLEESKDQIIKSNEATISQLNNELNRSNELIEKLSIDKNGNAIRQFPRMNRQLSDDEKKVLKDIESNSIPHNNSLLAEQILDRLVSEGLLKPATAGYSFTSYGNEYRDQI